MTSPIRRRSRSSGIDRSRQREKKLWKEGFQHIAGVDEAGIGPLAGPVVAAAVILPPDFDAKMVNDSKKLSHKIREERFTLVQEMAVAWSISAIEPLEIDKLNVYHAGLEAMRRAVEGLSLQVGHALVDGRTIPNLECNQTRIVGGDACEATIAAASILAKVHRDRIMVDLDKEFPGYGFAGHKGYPTPAHKSALEKLGPSPVHRMSYPAVQQLCGTFSPLFHQFLTKTESLKNDAELTAFRKEIRQAGTTLTDIEKKRLRAILTRQQARRK